MPYCVIVKGLGHVFITLTKVLHSMFFAAYGVLSSIIDDINTNAANY